MKDLKNTNTSYCLHKKYPGHFNFYVIMEKKYIKYLFSCRNLFYNNL